VVGDLQIVVDHGIDDLKQDDIDASCQRLGMVATTGADLADAQQGLATS
jgi:hypothetical protein